MCRSLALLTIAAAIAAIGGGGGTSGMSAGGGTLGCHLLFAVGIDLLAVGLVVGFKTAFAFATGLDVGSMIGKTEEPLAADRSAAVRPCNVGASAFDCFGYSGFDPMTVAFFGYGWTAFADASRFCL